MRELRHDFRRHYGCSYDEVPVDEAIDLIETLPAGSLWRASQRPYGEWDDAQERCAQVIDAVSRFMHLFAHGTTEGAQRVMRPEDIEELARARSAARSVRSRIEDTEWEEVDGV